MDVGNPSNFDRLLWLYDGDLEAMRRRYRRKPPRRRRSAGDDPARVRRARLPARSAQRDRLSRVEESASGPASAGPPPGVFLATAHPAKFAEIVEPVIGRTVEKPRPLVEALATKRTILEADATPEAVEKVLG